MAVTLTVNFGFQKPDPDSNIDVEIRRLKDVTLDAIDAALKSVKDVAEGKAAANHGHAIADIDGLSTALANKMPANQSFSLDSLTDVEGAGAAAVGQILWKTAGGWVPSSPLAALGEHGHTIAEITGLIDALALKAKVATVSSTEPTAGDGQDGDVWYLI